MSIASLVGRIAGRRLRCSGSPLATSLLRTLEDASQGSGNAAAACCKTFKTSAGPVQHADSVKDERKKPSKPVSAYNVFVSKQFAYAKEAAGASASAPEVMRQMAAHWKSMGDGEKKEYQDVAAAKKAEWEKANPPKQKKAPPTAYSLYVRSEYPSVAAANPGKKLPEVSSIIAQRWKAMGDGSRRPYVDAAATERAAWERSKGK